MEKKEFRKILDRYVEGTCTEQERMWVEHWYNLRSDSEQVPIPGEEIEVDLLDIRSRLNQNLLGKRRSWAKYAAAILVFAVGVGVITHMVHETADAPPTLTLAAPANDVLPGGNKAVLSFADGRNIELSREQGELIIGSDYVAYGDGSPITGGSLWNSRALHESQTPQMLHLATPNGGQYQITLPDGTKVWINAASSLTYPSAFVGEARVVELEGEAYFAVAHDSNRPFKVMSRGQEIQVLGTEFNIAAYPDEHEIQTTLVEGSVRLTALSTRESMLLAPSEQGILTEGGIRKKNVDVVSYIAWKEGYFHFDNTPLKQMMRQMSRWYDITVVYKSGVSADRFNGTMPRNVTLQTVLELLRISEIKYSLQGTELIIE